MPWSSEPLAESPSGRPMLGAEPQPRFALQQIVGRNLIDEGGRLFKPLHDSRPLTVDRAGSVNVGVYHSPEFIGEGDGPFQGLLGIGRLCRLLGIPP